MCMHRPTCPEADTATAGTAQEVAWHPELGWALLCNGVLVVEEFDEWDDDGGPADLCLTDLAGDGWSDLQAAFEGWRWRVPGTTPVVGGPAETPVAQQSGDLAG